MKFIVALACVVQLWLWVAAWGVPALCPPRDCTKEYQPVCAKSPDTDTERTFPNNCTRLFLGCNYIYLRDGKCTEDWTLDRTVFEQVEDIGGSFQRA